MKPWIWCGVCLLLLSPATVRAQHVEWRFGFEDTYSQLGGVLNQEQKDFLLSKLEVLVEAQQAGGDININGTAGGWNAMQPLETASISFANADELVQTLQNHGFSMLWNLRLNAPWAKNGNDDCYDTGIITSCAPGPDHEQDLYDYIFALVERYDGDGVEDMGHETPGDPTDDLRIPIQFYLMTGEIEFAGATPIPEPGTAMLVLAGLAIAAGLRQRNG